MPQNPPSDFVSPNVRLLFADVAGVKEQTLPVVKTKSSLSHIIPVVLLFDPIPYQQFELEIKVQERARLHGDVNAVYVRYPNDHDYFTQLWNLPICPFDSSLSRIWVGGNISFLPDSDTQTGFPFNVILPNHLRLRVPTSIPSSATNAVHAASSFPAMKAWSLGYLDGSVQRLSGEGMIGGLQLDVEISVPELHQLEGRSARVELILSGASVATKTLMAISDHERFATYGNLREGMPISGAQVTLLDGRLFWNQSLFLCSGPGLPLEMSLHYSSGQSALWRAIRPSTDYEKMVYAPFGHGWSNLFTMHIFKMKEERSTRPSIDPPREVTWYIFQDADGSMIRLDTGAFSDNKTISNSFGCTYSTLGLVVLANGYELSSPESHLTATFDADGRLIKWSRSDHRRPITVQYAADRITIRDSQLRTAILTLTDSKVSRIEDPKGRVWQLEYTDDTLDRVVQNSSGCTYEFLYDDTTYLLTRLKGPAIDTEIEYHPIGGVNPWTSGAVKKISEGDYFAEFSWRTLLHGEMNFDVFIDYPLGRRDIHQSRMPIGLSWTWWIRRGAMIYSIDLLRGPDEATQNMPEPYDANRVLRKLPEPTYSYQGGTRCRRLASINDRPGVYTQFEYEDKPEVFDLISKITSSPDVPNGVGAETLFFHNDDGNVIETQDPIGVVTSHTLMVNDGFVGLVKQKVVDPGNLDLTLEWNYDEMGNVVEEVNAESESRTVTFDDLDRITRVVEEDGLWMEIEYDPLTGLLSKMTTPAGVIMELQYTAQGLVRREFDPDTGFVAYYYNELFELIREEHDQAKVSYVYDQTGRIEEIREEADTFIFRTQHRYDPWGNIIETTEISGNEPPVVTTYDFDSYNRIERVTGPEVTVNGVALRPMVEYQYESPTTFISGYNAYQGLIKVTTTIAPGLSEIIEYGYDLAGRLVSLKKQNPPAGAAIEEFVYDAADNLIQHKGDNFNYTFFSTRPRPNRNRTQRQLNLDTASRASSVADLADPTKVLVSVERDKEGRVTELKIPDANGNPVVVEERQYTNGLLTSVRNEDGDRTTIGYDSSSRPATIVDPIGNRTTYEYDVSDRVTRVFIEGFDGSTFDTRYTYRISDGQLESISQLRSGTYDRTEFTYNSLGLLEKQINPSGITYTYRYGAHGRITSIEDGVGHETLFEYDNANNLSKKTYHDGRTISYVYDIREHLISIEDSNYRRAYIRDPLGRIETESFTDRGTGTTSTCQFRYDDYGALAEVEDDLGNITSFHRDDNNLITQIEFGPVNQTVIVATYRYDPQGRLIEKASNGFVLQYEWDATGFLKKIQAQKGNTLIAKITYAKDVLGRRSRAEYEHLNLKFAWSYDGIGRLKQELITDLNDFLLRSGEYTYDEAGNMLLAVENGSRVERRYNAFNQIIGTTVSRLLVIPASSFSATTDSQLDNSHTVDLVLDGVAPGSSGPGESFLSETTATEHWIEITTSQPATVAAMEISIPDDHGLPQELRLSYRDVLTSQWLPLDVSFLEGANRMSPPSGTSYLGIEPGRFTIRLVFLPVQFSVIRITLPAGAGSQRHANTAYRGALAISELRFFQATSEVLAYVYDANGNLIDDGIRMFSYNQDNRLTAIQWPGVLHKEFEYGPDGAIILERDILRNTTVKYRYLLGERYAQVDLAGNILQQYVPGGPMEIYSCMIESGGLYHTVNDAIGTIHQVVDPTGVRELRLSDAWGKNLEEVVNASPGAWATFLQYGFVGRPSLGEDGMDLGARTYFTSLQRFTSPDPNGIAETPNRYLYALNDPINLYDREGRIFTHLLGGLASVAVGYAISKVTGKEYALSDAAVDFGVGFASSGLSSLAKCAKLGSTLHTLSQAGTAARLTAKAAPIAGSTALGVAGDYATAKLKGEEFDLASSLLFNSVGAFAGAFFSRPYCFPAGTLVETEFGEKPIESIRQGERIITRIYRTNQNAIRSVTKVTRSKTEWLLRIRASFKIRNVVFDGERLQDAAGDLDGSNDVSTSITESLLCTPDHLIYIVGRKWTPASEVKTGDQVVSENGFGVIEAKDILPCNEWVYNLEVEEGHCYFVKTTPNGEGILVHNACPKDVQDAAKPHFAQLDEWRKKFPDDRFSKTNRGAHTFAVGMVEGSQKRFWSRNQWVATFRKFGLTGLLARKFRRFGPKSRSGVNVYAKTHAEAGALNQLYKHAIRKGETLAGKRVVLVVDKEVCANCLNKGGLLRMAKRMQLEELVIVWREADKSGIYRLAGDQLEQGWIKSGFVGDWVKKLLSTTHKKDVNWISRPLNTPPKK